MKTLIAFDTGQFTGKTFMLLMNNDHNQKLKITEIVEVCDDMLYRVPDNSYIVPNKLAKEFLKDRTMLPNLDHMPDSETITVPTIGG